MKESDDNPIDPSQRLRDAPRCHAKAKRTGERCKCPAVTGWRVCRVHGAGGGHAAGKEHPRWKHGMRSREWVDTRRAFNEMVREARELDRASQRLVI
jgi:hypothetical protein